jgi:CRP/FNR family cyclic AMP-dependent transcriptional regulator
VLISGQVKLYYGSATGDRLLVRIASGGSLFGFTDFEATDPHESEQGQLFTAQTLSRCKVAIIARARVVRLLHGLSGPEVVRVVQSVNAEWVRLHTRLLRFLTMDVCHRLAYAIDEIAESFGVADDRGKLIALRLSHEDLAEFVGASRPMVSKHLKELSQSGIFRKENGRYILLREAALKAILSSSRSFRVEAPRLEVVARASKCAEPRPPTSTRVPAMPSRRRIVGAAVAAHH